MDVSEQPNQPEDPDDLLVFNDRHPRPADSIDKAGLKRYLRGVVAEQAGAFRPESPGQWNAAREKLEVGYRVRVPVHLPAVSEIEAGDPSPIVMRDDLTALAGVVRRDGGETVPYLILGKPDTVGQGSDFDVALVVHPKGKAGLIDADGRPGALVRGLLDRGQVVVAIDAYLTGDHHSPFKKTERASTQHFRCYNRVTLVERVQDVLTVLAALDQLDAVGSVDLVGVGEAGAWCLLALPHAPSVGRTVVDADAFDYRPGETVAQERVLPGVLRFGGLRSFGTLAAPAELWVHNTGDRFDASWVTAAYRLAGAAERLKVSQQAASPDAIAEWLTGG